MCKENLTTKWFIVSRRNHFTKLCAGKNLSTGVFRNLADQYLQTFLTLVSCYLLKNICCWIVLTWSHWHGYLKNKLNEILKRIPYLWYMYNSVGNEHNGHGHTFFWYPNGLFSHSRYPSLLVHDSIVLWPAWPLIIEEDNQIQESEGTVATSSCPSLRSITKVFYEYLDIGALRRLIQNDFSKHRPLGRCFL